MCPACPIPGTRFSVTATLLRFRNKEVLLFLLFFNLKIFTNQEGRESGGHPSEEGTFTNRQH